MPEISCLQKLSQEDRAEFWASLALRYAKNIGIRTATRLMQHYGSALNAINHIDIWEDSKLKENKKDGILSGSWREEAQIEWNEANHSAGEIILWTDYHYPAQLKQLVDAPLFFYARGNTELLLNVCIAIVGSRQHSSDGAKSARNIAYNLAKSGITVVSGLAKGIDRYAHIGAVNQIGSTIGILGSGLEVIYPKENTDIFNALEEYALIISEFSPLAKPEARNFPIRNRLISGLSLGVLVIEASIKSGSLITARTALEQNRNVYAIPGPSYGSNSEGCHKLIREGANPVFSFEDILIDLPNLQYLLDYTKQIEQKVPEIIPTNKILSNSIFKPPAVEDVYIEDKVKTASKTKIPAKREHNFSPESPEALLIKIIKSSDSVQLEQIIEQSALSSSKVSSLLTILEIKKVIKRQAGSFYTYCE